MNFESGAPRIAAAEHIKELGNKYFKENNFKAAADKYSKALRYLAEAGDNDEEELAIQKARVPCRLNLYVEEYQLIDGSVALVQY